MEEVTGLDFSTEALQNRPNFYEGFNDINLFVEDAESQYFYEEIFKRLLGDRYSIKTIFPCSGKPAVIKMFNERGSVTANVRNIYIVDGDFDRVLFPEKMISNPQFIYLKKYNIESCLINELGLCKLVKSKLKCIDAEAIAKLKYKTWFTRIVDEAKELFLCYCYIQKFHPEKPNVNRSHYEFLDHKTGFKRKDGSFESYRNELYSEYPDAKEKIETIRSEFMTRFGNCYDILICGKFLISSLHDYLYTIIKKSIPNDDLLWCLVENFDVEELDYVRKACIQSMNYITIFMIVITMMNSSK